MGENGPQRRVTNLQDGFPNCRVLRNCPVEGYQGRAAMRTAIQLHFLHRHFRDNVIIPEEGNLPHPKCPRCDMLVPWKDLNRKHITTAQCAKGAEQKIWRLEKRRYRRTRRGPFRPTVGLSRR